MGETTIIDKILILINLTGMSCFLGVFVFREFIYKRPIPKEQREFELFKAKESEEISGTPLKLEKIIINLPSTAGQLHYINLELGLIPFLGHHKGRLETNKAVILDAIITITSKMRYSELNTMTGKLILEERLKKGMNEALGRAYIKKVLFTTYIIQ